MLLAVKQQYTSLVQLRHNSETQETSVRRLSNNGTATGSDLTGKSVCRMCNSVVAGYSEAFHHMSEFRCHVVKQAHAVVCPQCKKGPGFIDANSFIRHCREQHEDDFENEAHLKVKGESHYNARIWLKVFSLVWMIELFKKTMAIWGKDEKPFLPFLSSGMLSVRKTLNCEPCPWPICAAAQYPQPSDLNHQHKHDTNPLNGRCNFCKNFHQIPQKGTRRRMCAKVPHKGTLPV